jgi:hypothetical protein
MKLGPYLGVGVGTFCLNLGFLSLTVKVKNKLQ